MANEKRLVNAEAIARKLKNAHCAGCNVVRKVQCSACWVEDVLELLEGDAVDAVEVVHGRWLFDSNTERCFCSACNEEALYTSKDDPIFDYDWEENLRYSHTETILEEHLTNYCPNCGADMRERKSEHEN